MDPLKTRRDTLLHDLFVIHRIPNVNVGFKRDMRYCRIEIEDVRRTRGVDSVQMGIEALYKGRLARAGHPDRDDDSGLSRLGTGGTRGGAHRKSNVRLVVENVAAWQISQWWSRRNPRARRIARPVAGYPITIIGKQPYKVHFLKYQYKLASELGWTGTRCQCNN